MALKLLDKAPAFAAKQQDGRDFEFERFARGKWSVVFSYLADFTPVCLTELSEFSSAQEQFQKRNCGIVAISPDSVESHKEWLKDVAAASNTRVNFPVISDETRGILRSLGFLSSDEQTPVRGLYLVDPEMRVQFIQVMPQAIGRSVKEILRILDALQVSAYHDFVATPAEWVPGEDLVQSPNHMKKDESKKRGRGKNDTDRFQYLKFIRLDAGQQEVEITE